MTSLIVDYGLCNLDSVSRAVEECGGEPLASSDPSDVELAAKIILPGVGSFAEAMSALNESGWTQALRDAVLNRGVPMLGICLGMQLLAGRGTEGGETEGLNFIPGRIEKLVPDAPQTRIPHVGWNEVEQQQSCPLFAGIPDRKDFYFVHSYHFVPEDPAHALATTPYCGTMVSTVGRDNVFGTQFHPEKSLGVGFQLLRNFLTPMVDEDVRFQRSRTRQT